MDINKCETYQTTESVGGHGFFFFTDCGNRMYSVRDEMAYHGYLCPHCGKTLYIRGSAEAEEYFAEKYKK